MITFKTMKQIATSHTIPSFQNGRSLTRLSTASTAQSRRSARQPPATTIGSAAAVAPDSGVTLG